ncbi:hypothetical protein [Tepidibacillus sp. HK-1]|uniref:hypothetical protein n=1 Tax=Tepidibacillus sp. HK-1 TaxID=1883407 RepID=UPI0008533A1B|nr:hypothetical protein [Tepidibacillus sp. HK-1]GBF12373.1 hypothetical protein HK1_02434 [Tepidibacillus sp. HK-1]
MKKKFTMLTLILTMLALVLPFQINLTSIHAKQRDRSVLFFGPKDANYVVEYIQKTSVKDDDSIIKEKVYLNNSKLKVKTFNISKADTPITKNYTDIAYPLNDVKENDNLKTYLKQMLDEGKTVYLYGDVSYNDYKEVLGLDQLSVKQSNGMVLNLAVPATEKKDVKNRTQKTYDIVGYSTVGGHNLYTGTIKSNENLTEYNYLREILYYVSTKIDNEDTENQNALGFLTQNKAFASSNIIRKSSPTTWEISAYDGSTLVGRVDTDWDLAQNTDETVHEWDYFTLETRTITNAYNAYVNGTVHVNHDLVASVDDLQYGSPGNGSGTSWSISIGYPWNINIGYSTTNSVDLSLNTQTVDPEYNHWTYSGQANGDLMKLMSAWKSSTVAFYVPIDINISAEFILWDQTPTVKPVSDSYSVRYSYDKSTSPGY